MTQLAFEPRPPPLTETAGGALRVEGTRVSLESVVHAFDMGATPEEIVQRFPTLDIASTYEVIAYVLRNRADVDAYVAERSRVAAESCHRRPVTHCSM